jgi:hypothetical protein
VFSKAKIKTPWEIQGVFIRAGEFIFSRGDDGGRA